jgi:DNA-binding MarR family transcriptional regulator
MAIGTMDRSLRTGFDRSLDDYDVLHQLSLHDRPIRMGELAERLLVANSSCNRIIGRLVDDGLVTRQHGEHDKREVLVGLTGEGKRLRRRMAAVHTRDIERLFGAPLSDYQRATLNEALEALIANLQAADH